MFYICFKTEYCDCLSSSPSPIINDIVSYVTAVCGRVCVEREKKRERVSRGGKHYIILKRKQHKMFSIDLRMCLSDFSSLMFVPLGLNISMRSSLWAGLAFCYWHGERGDVIVFANGESNHLLKNVQLTCSLPDTCCMVCFALEKSWCTGQDVFGI